MMKSTGLMEQISGRVDVVVVGCHAFDPGRKRLMAFDTCRTEHLLEEWREGLVGGWQLGNPLVVALACDAQEVDGWPDWAQGHAADAVITATRVIALGRGEQVVLAERSGEPRANG